MRKPLYILGLNFAYHELSACLVKDGKLLAAVEEERFSRIKRGKKSLVGNPDTLPLKSIEYCLKVGGITLNKIDYIGLSFLPEDRLKNIGTDKYFNKGDWGSEEGEKLFYKKIKRIPMMLNKIAGQDISKKIHWIPHHICHASSAFFVSPFKKSAIISIDGIGEFSSTWMGIGQDNKIRVIKEVNYPNSVGFLWEKISKYLGFTEYDSSKVMGLAAYGNPDRFYKQFQTLVSLLPNGEFLINNSAMRFRIDDFSQLESLFGVRKINTPNEIGKDQEDISAGLQKITNDVILHLAEFIQQKTISGNLCLAGGVALNCVSNQMLMNSSLFRNIYVQPAANDAGTALGAAYYIWNQMLGGKRSFVMEHAYWGPEYTDKEIREALDRAGLKYEKAKNLVHDVAARLAEGNIIGWFQGRSEWGPRALGNRSLLADPRSQRMKNLLNIRIKKREPFRPFAPSVLREQVQNWFSISPDCRSISTEFMEINFDVSKDKHGKIPAVTHKDNTSRAQVVNKNTNPLYHKLITSFLKQTGVPLVLNTSFNDNEPIVCSPEDAIKTFMRTKMDHLAIGEYLVGKEKGPYSRLRKHTKKQHMSIGHHQSSR
ncbi:MAG: carbamoyltransferase C-terminal domain-containing protein [bacterium]|nr:carbamoyltransferase C-terminal domain-containing protein [bacterium]